MSIFFTDSNSEIWYERFDKLGIEYISMPYTIDDVEYYYDLGRNTNFKEFYEKVSKGSMPITSALNPQNYIDIFTPFLEQGNDIIYVTFSHAMSGTFEHMKTAIAQLKEKFPERSIKYVDTRSISIGASIIAYYAALEYKKGASDDEIIKFVEDLRDNISVYFVVDDLMHLKRGGRLSGFSATIGTMLGIKPILKFNEEGKIITYGKIKGKKKALLKLVDLIKEKGQNVADYPIAINHANCLDDALFLKSKIEETFGKDIEIWLQDVGPTIGTHCGPGTIGLAFHGKK